jgi:hypothetical protein
MGVDSLAEDCPDSLNCKETRLTINKPNKIIRRIENSSEYPFSSSCSSSVNVGYNPLALRAAPFVKGECAPGSKRIPAQSAFRPAFGVQPVASGTTVVHFPCEPLRDKSTATENDNQKRQIDEDLRHEPSKSIRLYPWNFTDWLGV